MKKYFLALFLLTFIVPSIAFASWWNPFSWSMFHKKEVTPQVQVETQKTPEEKINDLQKQLDDLKKQQQVSTPTTTAPVVKKEVKKTTPVVIPVATKPETEKTVYVPITPQKIIAPIRQPIVPVSSTKTCISGAVISVNENCTKICPDGEVVLENLTCKIVKNYYIETKSRVRTLIGMESTYKTWLQDTSDQLRSAVLTLSGYSIGGLGGQARDADIKLANAEISVISGLIMKSSERTANLESMQDLLNNNPKMFIDETTFNSTQTPESDEADIAGAKQSINSYLDSVMTGLQIH